MDENNNKNGMSDNNGHGMSERQNETGFYDSRLNQSESSNNIYRGGNGVYPDRPDNSYSSYSYNGGQNNYSNTDYYSTRQSENGGGNEKKQKNRGSGSKGVTAVLFTLVCVMLCALCFFVGQRFGYTAPDSGGGGNISEGGNGGDNTGITGGGSHLQNGNFKLEQVTAEEHYKLSSVYSMTMNSVVEITTESVQTGSFMQQYVKQGAGSGIIFTEDGYIVTNHHVIDQATKITVTLPNGDKYDAELVGTDQKTDLAVLKINASGLSPVTLGKSGDLLIGEQILVIGNPLGSLGGSATTGIISATQRNISVEGQLMTLLQTNAAINPGNSGGAMFNMSGQLVGIVNAKYTDEAVEGIGFAIPIDTAKAIIENLINYGYVTGRPNIGITIEYGTSRYLQSVGATNWITEVASGSDASKAGLKVMDQIVSVNGKVFSNAESLNAYLDTLKVGETIAVVVNRYTSVNIFEYSVETLTYNFILTEYVAG